MKNLPVIILATINTRKAIVTSNVWKVTSFMEKGIDRTPDFSTYLFQFNSDGSAIANSTGIGILYYGTSNLLKVIHTTLDDSGNHSGSEEQKLIITLTGNHHMDEINEDWKIVKLIGTEMWLMDNNIASSKEIHFTMN